MRITKKYQFINSFWLLFSLIIAAIYSLLALKQAFAGDYVVQDDVRQHVFWMLRYGDPQLFPNDPIADYFQSIAPWGYSTVYRLVANWGINPLVFNKFLPLAIALISSYYCFAFCQQIFPYPAAAGVATILLNQSLWFKDDLVSATPRAFVYPFFLAFLYYLTKKSLFPCLIAIAGIGFFYPQYLFLCAGLLSFQLINWVKSGIIWDRLADNQLYLLGLILSCSILLFYAVTVSEYGPTITRAEAIQLPEFYPGGRASFFKANFWDYLLDGGRGGLFPKALFTPATLTLGLLLPILGIFPRQFPLVKYVNHNRQLLLQIIIISLIMFGLAHAVLFQLHLPSRYNSHCWRIVLALAAGISTRIIGDALVRQLQKKVDSKLNWLQIGKKILLGSLGIAIAISILAYPRWVNKFPVTRYKVGTATELYQFLQQQPKDIKVASLISEADNIPTFAQRSVLVASEYAIPYHTGYYFPFRQRVAELIAAQYSNDLNTLQRFISKYQISFFLLENSSLTPQYLEGNDWLMSHQPIADEALESLKEGNIPAMANLEKKCSVFTEVDLNLISAACIASE